jgi:hypothetical protein
MVGFGQALAAFVGSNKSKRTKQDMVRLKVKAGAGW